MENHNLQEATLNKSNIEKYIKKSLKDKANYNKDGSINWDLVNNDVMLAMPSAAENEKAYTKLFNAVADKMDKSMSRKESIEESIELTKNSLTKSGNTKIKQAFKISKIKNDLAALRKNLKQPNPGSPKRVAEITQTKGLTEMSDKHSAIFDKLKKNDTVKIKFDSTLSKGEDFIEYKVLSKTTVLKGKPSEQEKITLQRKAGGVKSFLRRKKNGKITFAIGDMGTSLIDMKERVEYVDEAKLPAKKIIKDLEAKMSIDAIVGKYIDKRSSNKDAILKIIRDYNWNKFKQNINSDTDKGDEAISEALSPQQEARQLKNPKTEVMVVDKAGKTIVIDKTKQKEYLAKGWKLAESVLDEATTPEMKKAAKELKDYAKKHGGMDRKDFVLAADIIGTGRIGQDFIKFVNKLDTEPNEKIITVMAKHMGKQTIEKMFGVNIREEIDLEEANATIAQQKAIKALMSKALSGKRAKAGTTSRIADNGDFVVADGGGRIIGRLKAGTFTNPLKEAVGTSAKYKDNEGLFGGKYTSKDRAAAMSGKKFIDWRKKNQSKHDDEHKKSDPKMFNKGYAKHMVDTDKAEKNAKKRGIKPTFDKYKAKNGLNKGKLPESEEK